MNCCCARNGYYLPFSLHLIEFRHDKYPGTDIPKNFSSRVRLQNLENGEDREVRIFMNNPLRYAGETFYQASFDPDDHGSVLQVVHNPSWLTPYFACVLVATGLVIQFLSHLIPFLKRRTGRSRERRRPGGGWRCQRAKPSKRKKMNSLKANAQCCAKRPGVRQPSGAFGETVSRLKAVEGHRTPKPCGHLPTSWNASR